MLDMFRQQSTVRIRALIRIQNSGPVEPDLIVFNTCAVRENADQRLYGTLGNLKKTKQNHPGMQIAVGGCLAQKTKMQF